MLLNIYLKEIKDCFRDRRTLLLTVFLPIIMMSALILFYEKLGSDGEGETFTLAVPEAITEAEEAIFQEFKNIELVPAKDPEQTLGEGDAQAALLLPEAFTEKVQSGEKAEAVLIGDSFSQNSSNLMAIVTNALSVYEKSVVADRLQDQGIDPVITQPFTIEQKELSGEDMGINLIAMLVPMMLALAIGVGAGPAAADLFAGEKEKKTMEALLMTPVKRPTLLFSKWLTISTIGTLTGIVTLAVVSLEIAFLTENLKNSISFGDNVYTIIGAGLLISLVYAMFVASILLLTSVIAKTIKEAQSYSTPVMMMIIFPTLILSNIGVNEMETWHFLTPVLNIFGQIKELLFGIVDYQHIFFTVASNLAVIIIIFIIGRIMFLKDKWVMN